MIKIHHLNFSRSTRIIWLMEELELPYEIVAYQREATRRAPAALKAVHPLGKAPVIEDGDLMLAESGAIIEYLVTAYGGGKLAPAKDGPRWGRYIEWLHYAEGSAMLPIMFSIIGHMTCGLPEGMQGFVQPEIEKTLTYIASRITSSGYLLEEGFSAADIQMSYVLEIAQMMGLLASYPTLANYLAYIKDRPAYERAIAAGGPVAISRQ